MQTAMLRITQTRMHAAAAASEASFARDCAAVLRNWFPAETSTITDTALAERITRGIAEASALGIALRHGTRCFLALSIIFGEGFLDDPGNAWMHAYLNDPEVPDETQRMTRLVVAAAARLDAATREHALRARFADVVQPFRAGMTTP
jgi:hypothetical protein